MFTLLWIELLLSALLWVACADAVASRIGRTLYRSALVFVGFFVPGMVLGGLAGVSGKFYRDGVGINWLGFTGSLFIAWTAGAIWLTVFAFRRGPRRWARGQNWPRTGLAMATAMALVVAGMTLLRMDLAAMSHASGIRLAAGRVMEALAPAVETDTNNAAQLFTHAFAQLRGDGQFQHDWSDAARTEKDPRALRALLIRRSDTIAQLRLGSAMPYCRFDHDYAMANSTMAIPELDPAFRSQWLMQLAVSEDLQNGQVDLAVADVTVMFHMAREITQVPVIVDGLVRGAMEERAIGCLADVLPTIKSIRQLDAFDIGPDDFVDVLVSHDLAGEESMGIATISGFIADSAHRQHGSSELSPYLAPPVGSIIRLYLASDLDSYCAYMDKVRESADRPWRETHDGTNGPGSPQLPVGEMTHLFRIDPANYIRAMNVAQARHASAMLAIAAVRYRLEHGKLPNQLADLVPAELAALPPDPFTGQPMLLAKRKDRWIIYSVGPNGKDDGGTEYDQHTQAGDVGFSLRMSNAAGE